MRVGLGESGSTGRQICLGHCADFWSAGEISGGVNFLVFGDALKAINGSADDVEPIGVFGISLSY